MISFMRFRHPLMVLAILVFSSDAIAQLRELARDRARRKSNETINIPASPGHFEPKSIEELTRESVVVVVGTLTQKGSYLNSTGDRVHTDYVISDAEVITGDLSGPPESLPGEVAMPIVTRLGGEVVFEGIRIRGGDSNFEPMMNGRRYLLFLRTARQSASGRYEVYHGGIFEIGSEDVKPLLKSGDAVFRWTTDHPLAELVAKIRASGKDH